LQLQLQVGKYSTVGHEFNLAGSTFKDEEKGEGKTFRVDKVGFNWLTKPTGCVFAARAPNMKWHELP